MNIEGILAGGKETWAWIWPLTSI